MSKKKITTLLPKKLWKGPKNKREDLLKWMSEEEQSGVSSEFQNIIRHLGNGIYLEDEIEIEKYIRGSSPEETLELQNKFFKDYQTLEKLIANHRNDGPRETDRKILKRLVRKIDKSLSKRKKKKPSSVSVGSELIINYKKYDKENIIKCIHEDYIEYGNKKTVDFGQEFTKLLSESRKELP